MELLEAKEELKEVNTQLTLYMKKKKALQEFINEEERKIKQHTDPRLRAFALKKDTEFITLYGRERTAKEIARIMHYSERQVQRYLKED